MMLYLAHVGQTVEYSSFLGGHDVYILGNVQMLFFYIFVNIYINL